MLGILTTHPIQYQVPVWRALAQRGRVPVEVFYMSDLGLKNRFDPGFGRKLAWDIDLLGHYRHSFVGVSTATPAGFWSLRLKPGFGLMLRERGVRALWIQGWQVAAYWQAVWEARRLGVEVWLRGETNSRSNGDGLVQGMKRTVLRRLLRRVDRFLYIGNANRRFYLSQGIGPGRLSPAPYCVDNARFAVQAAQIGPRRQLLRSSWHIPDEAFCFLFMGKLMPKKRPSDLVAAVRRLRKDVARPVHILFVGTGELEDELRRSCVVAHDAEPRRLSGSDAAGPPASFLGFLNQTEVSRAYVAADCLVLPSDTQETWGLVVNEAMASGLPCMVSDACGCAEDLVVPIRPELSYPVGDIAGLTRALQAVMADPPPRELLESHIERYDYMRTVETVEQLYAEMTELAAA